MTHAEHCSCSECATARFVGAVVGAESVVGSPAVAECDRVGDESETGILLGTPTVVDSLGASGELRAVHVVTVVDFERGSDIGDAFFVETFVFRTAEAADTYAATRKSTSGAMMVSVKRTVVG